MRLLCVEDEPALREDIAEFLRMQSYEVDEAGSGEEAMQRLSTGQYDLILCDIKMPQMDGYELLRHVRAANNMVTTPFLFLSALDERNDKIQAYEKGCDGYLTKPVDFSVLDATLKAHVERERARAFSHLSNQQLSQRHMMVAIDDVLNGPMQQVVGVIQNLCDSLPELTQAGVDEHLNTLHGHLQQHVEELQTFHDVLAMRTQSTELNYGTILSSDLIKNAMKLCAYHNPATQLRHKADSAIPEMLTVDIGAMQRAISGLLAEIPNAFDSCDIITSEIEPERWTLTISDHPSMSEEYDFEPIDEYTNFYALSSVTRQRIAALNYALQVVQAHRGRVEIKLWPHDFLAVRFILPQPPE